MSKTIVLKNVVEEEDCWYGCSGGYFCKLPKSHWICELIDASGTGVFTLKTGQTFGAS